MAKRYETPTSPVCTTADAHEWRGLRKNMEILLERIRQARHILVETAYDPLVMAVLYDAPDEIETLREKLAIYERDAARYRWWREHIHHIEDDEDGLAGIAYSFQIQLQDIAAKTTAELMDAIADIALEDTPTAAQPPSPEPPQAGTPHPAGHE